MQKFIKYFLKNKAVTWLLLVLILAGGLFSYAKMGKLEDAPFTIKQALVLTPYPGASPSEVQSQVTDVLEEAIQSLGELYYLKTENRAGLSKITVYVKKEIRADEMQQLWDKLRRKVNDVQSKLPSGAGTSIVNDDFGDVLGVFYGLTGESYTYRELEDQAKLIKDDLLKVKDVAKVEIYGIQTPVIDIRINPTILSNRGITTADIKRAFDGQNKVVDAGSIRNGETRIRIESTGNFYSLDDIRNLTIVSHSGEHFRLGDIARIEEGYQTPPQNFMRINNKQAVGIAISTIPTGNVVDMVHSIYVDQWDWEKVIRLEDRNEAYLKSVVRSIVSAVCATEMNLHAMFPQLQELPLHSPNVTFITTQELEDQYPDLTPKERENAFVKEHGTTFLMKIGAPLKSGKPHDGRAPDYDDWDLNGDLLFWNDPLQCSYELSSMGIRVSPESMDKQLTMAGCDDRRALPFHKA